jgi:death on curing protein
VIQYIGLADYLVIAADAIGADVDDVSRVANIDLADSALHAPAAGFGETEFYPDFIDKAAVLVVRLVKNHPLPDGNKRAAWVALRVFIEINDWTWQRTPVVDDAERAVLAITAGHWSQEEMARWLQDHLAPPGSTP